MVMTEGQEGEPNNGSAFQAFAYIVPARILVQSQSYIQVQRKLCQECGCVYNWHCSAVKNWSQQCSQLQ